MIRFTLMDHSSNNRGNLTKRLFFFFFFSWDWKGPVWHCRKGSSEGSEEEDWAWSLKILI